MLLFTYILFFSYILNGWCEDHFGFNVSAKRGRILAVETLSARSHWNFMSAVLRSLTDAGHHVTVFTPFPEGDRANYREIDTSANMPRRVENDLMEMMNNLSRPLTMTNMATTHYRAFCDSVYKNRQLVETMRGAGVGAGGEKFDAIVMEAVGMDCMSYLANAMNLPIIYVIPSPMITYAERLFTGHVSNPACVAHMFARHAVPKTFAQRFVNTGLLVYSMLRTTYDEWLVKTFHTQPFHSSPTVHPSLIFQNSHFITEAPRPVPPNVIHVGGIHLKPPKSIPKDILHFIEDSPNGVIFFTFGSTVRISSFPEHIEKTFKDVLAKVPQRVLWKYETEMKDKPDNVMIRKWFPQREILLHPKVKLFISHGGISGIYEAVDAGIPILGFPLFYDQPRNLEHLVLAEMAIIMDVLNLSNDQLLNTISELIDNEKYMKNAKIASNRFKDWPMSPANSVAYWTEYVIRHKGAPHLKMHALNLTWYQYFLLDVIAIALIFIFLMLFIMYKVFKVILKYTQNVKVKTQ